MRVLIDRLTGADPGEELDDALLHQVYAVPELPWMRVNMVSTVDGAATGEGGTTGSINNPADKRVFRLLREQADAIVVGAGTARAEGYGVARVPLVLVSRQGRVPEKLLGATPGMVRLVTCRNAPGLGESRDALGADAMVVLGEDEVDLAGIRQALVDRGMANLLCEGGPQLLAGLLRAGEIDEICATFVPKVVGGGHIRMVDGPPLDVDLDLGVLLEQEGTLLGRWTTRRT